MIEQIIITSLFASAVMFLLYKWNLDFWKCDYCAGFWIGWIFLSILDLRDKDFDFTLWYVGLLALCASIPTYLIITTILTRYDNHRFTGRY